MEVRPLFLPALVLLIAAACCVHPTRAQDEWERQRERYTHWVDNQWQDPPAPLENPTPRIAVRLQPQPVPQQEAYRHHAQFGLMGPYYSRAIAPAAYGVYRAPAKFVPPSYPSSYNYQALLDEDNFCNIFGINPLDCDCD